MGVGLNCRCLCSQYHGMTCLPEENQVVMGLHKK